MNGFGPPPPWWPLAFALFVAAIVLAIAFLHAAKEDREFWRGKQ